MFAAPWETTDREREESVTVSIASQSSALPQQQPGAALQSLTSPTPCDAGLVHPTLTVPSFLGPGRGFIGSLLPLCWYLGTVLLARRQPVCQSALHFTHVLNPSR